MTSFKLWILAIRPRTLTAAVAPVLMASAMAFDVHQFDWLVTVLCLSGALFIQIGTNLANDYFDFKNGADTEERKGPTRVTQAGLIAPEVVRNGFIAAFVLSALIGGALTWIGGWPIAVLMVVSILSGILYTGGPKPLGYIGLGDLFVLIFFGPVAVGATYYLQTLSLPLYVVLAGLSPGLISVAILAVNNLRDVETDSKSGKRTLAVRFGKTFARYEYIFSILLAVMITISLCAFYQAKFGILCTGLVLIQLLPVMRNVLESDDASTLNLALGQTGQGLLFYSVLFSIGWLL